MKIAWFHSHFQNWMGGTKYVFEVVKALKRRKAVDDIVIFVETISEENKTRFKKAGIKVVPLLPRSSYSPLYWLLLPIYLRRMLKVMRSSYAIDSFDVLISSMFPANWLITQLGRGNTFQVCYEPYALFFDTNYRRGLPLIKRIGGELIRVLYKKYDMRAVSQMQEVMTISRYNASWIRSVYKRKAKVVYEGVDTTLFRKKRGEVSKLVGQPGRYFTILHSTDFTRIKNTWFLIKQMPKIVQQIPNCKLVVTTTLASPEKEKMLKFAEEKSFADHLIFLGFVPLEELPSLYSTVDVVVQPSIKQSGSLSVKEAMACEAIVIRSNDVPQEEIIDGTNGFLISPYDPNSLIKTLVKVWRMSNEEKEEIGKNARRSIIDRYTWDNVAENIISIINE